MARVSGEKLWRADAVAQNPDNFALSPSALVCPPLACALARLALPLRASAMSPIDSKMCESTRSWRASYRPTRPRRPRRFESACAYLAELVLTALARPRAEWLDEAEASQRERPLAPPRRWHDEAAAARLLLLHTEDGTVPGLCPTHCHD